LNVVGYYYFKDNLAIVDLRLWHESSQLDLKIGGGGIE
jgi:hypothetical protein